MADEQSPVSYGLEVRYTMRSFTRVLGIIASSVNLTGAEFRLLRTVDELRGATQAELAVSAAMDRPYVSSLVKKMIARGLLEASYPSKDRRRVSIAMTQSGRRVFEAIARETAVIDQLAMRHVTAGQRRTFLAVLARIRANLDPFTPGPITPAP